MRTNNDASEKQPRSIKTAPFAWQHKAVLRLITETFSESDQAPSARSLYVALTELASDNESETFTETKALIAHKAGLSISTVERLLKGFVQLNLVKITNNFSDGLKRPNTYTLLTLRHGDASLRIGRSRSIPDKVEESQKNNEETPLTEGTHRPAPRAADADSSVSNYFEEEWRVLELYRQVLSDQDDQWLPVKKYTDKVREALERLPDLETAKTLFAAAAYLVSEGRDSGTLSWKPIGKSFDCYLPAPNKRTGKRTIVRLILCNLEAIDEIAAATVPDAPDPLDDIPI